MMSDDVTEHGIEVMSIRRKAGLVGLFEMN